MKTFIALLLVGVLMAQPIWAEEPGISAGATPDGEPTEDEVLDLTIDYEGNYIVD